MSGGVDSAVAAALLVRQGHEVLGAFMHLWSEDDVPDKRENACCSTAGMEDARRTAAQLGIPLYVLNVRDRFKEEIVEPWLDASFAGQTPNPCLDCNRRIKIGHLFTRARALGCSLVATGHYARRETDESGRIHLARAADARKDQTYFLARLTEEQLETTLFPLGDLTKDEARAYAREFGLAVSAKRESQELSFIADDIPSFLTRHADGRLRPGRVLDLDGTEYPRPHGGLALYTIGQRRGLPVSGTPEPRYVVGRDLASNTLLVGDERALLREACTVSDLVLRHVPGTGTHRLEVQIRSRSAAASADVRFDGGHAEVRFIAPQRAITPGQAAVFYDGRRCLGAGIIASAA